MVGDIVLVFSLVLEVGKRGFVFGRVCCVLEGEASFEEKLIFFRFFLEIFGLILFYWGFFYN